MAKKIKEKHLCGLKSDLVRKQLNTYKKMVSDPRFICENCFRLSRKKKNLCQPLKLKKLVS